MISVIIPTLGERSDELKRLLNSLEKQTNQLFEVIVVSQANHQLVSDIIKGYSYQIKHLSLERRGLSYARNKGFRLVKGEIVTFSDDDCWYQLDAFEKVQAYFDQLSEPILCFKIHDMEQQQDYKTYPTEEAEIGFRDLFKKSSIELFIKQANIKSTDLTFNEDFGLGAKYPSGEENLLLLSLFRKGYKMRFIPEIIVYHKKPSIESRLTEQAFISKGPLFKKMFNTPLGLTMLTYFLIRKYSHLERPFFLYKQAVKELRHYKL